MSAITKFFAPVVSVLIIIGMFTGLYNPCVDPFSPGEVNFPVYEGETMTIDGGYVIVRGASAIPAEITAAEKLRGFLKEIGGVALEVVTDAAAPQAKEIIVGDTNRYAVDFGFLGNEGFVLKTQGEKIVIAGGKPRGTLYGVYDFLEKFLGCRWFNRDNKLIPALDALEVPATIDETEIPAFEYRASTTIQQSYDIDSALANRVNAGWALRELSTPEYGGHAGYDIGHSVDLVLKNVYDENPNYAAERLEYVAKDANGAPLNPDGYTNPCLTNEKAIDAFFSHVVNRIDKDNAACVSLGLNDSGDVCQCLGCRVGYAEQSMFPGQPNDGLSGVYVNFLNKICGRLEAMGEPYASVKISGFGYGIVQMPPKTRCHKNVVIYFCPIGMCYAHRAGECTDEVTRTTFDVDFRGWKEKCGSMTIFEYPLTYNHWSVPYPLWGNIQSYLQMYRGDGVLGLINCSSAVDDVAFYAMTGYLYARLLWNPGADMEDLYNTFLPRYYGAGWQYIREYIRITSEELTGKTIGGVTYHTNCLSGATPIGNLCMTNNQLKYIDKLWEKAKALTGAARQEQQLLNMRRAELSWRIWKSDNFRGEFWPLRMRMRSNRELFGDIWALGIQQHSEAGYPDDPGYVKPEDFQALRLDLLTPRYWAWRQLGRDNEGKIHNVWQMLWALLT